MDIVGYQVVDAGDEEASTTPPSADEEGNEFDGDDPFRSLRDREDPAMLLSTPRGFLAVRTPHQAFVKADTELKSGMCGGAVLDEGGECCGCVEGVVPTPPADANVPNDVRLLQGAACMVESKDIAEFLREDDVFAF